MGDALALLALLVGLELVLGVDNILVIAIFVGRLPAERRDTARLAGLAFALVARIGMLVALLRLANLTNPVLLNFSVRDLILISGGLFLLYKASHEIFVEVEARELHGPGDTPPASATQGVFWGVIAQIGVIDIVFSLDSVITAVGMVNQIGVMAAAVVASVAVMLVAAKPIGDFVDRHPSVKVLALSFLVMVGMALTAEAFEVHVPKGFIYGAMAFSLAVETLNIRARAKRRAAAA